MRPTSPGTRGSVGACGAGKSYGIRKEVEAAVRGGMPVAVLDQNGEWNDVPRDIASVAAVVSSAEEAREAHAAGRRLLVVQLDDVEPTEGDDDAPKVSPQLRSAAVQLAIWAREEGRADFRGLALPEVQNVAPNRVHTLPTPIGKLVTAYRHGGTKLWWDSQRISLVNRTLVDLTRELHLFAIIGDSDLKTVRGIGTDGHLLVDAMRDAAERLAPHDPDPGGDPDCIAGRCDHVGWHVVLPIARIPPYELVRG